jgi:ATP-dependent RNA helicase RhlB
MELAYDHMNRPEQIKIKPDQISVKRIEEQLFYPGNNEKIPLLIGLMRKIDPHRSIVFANTKRDAERVWGYLAANGFKAGLLTGDIAQNKRLRLLDELASDTIEVLIATDVAARGLHIPDVTHVFNYDLPDDKEDYVHRIGRTARAGAEGVAISFACEDNAFNLPAIETYIGHQLPVFEVNPVLETRPLNPRKHLSRPRSNRRPAKRPRRA